jgi:arylsulfatase A-like enzyme
MFHFIKLQQCLRGFPIFFCFSFVSFTGNFSYAQKTRPNIIYIMADDLGYADLSGYGRKNYQTPNLDKLASQGIKFTNAYAAGALCTPTRTAFMTGRYPARTSVGLWEPLRGNSKDSSVGLKPEETSIATLLKKAGYNTALIGKWHLGFLPEFNPRKNGFDYFFGFHPGAIDYISHSYMTNRRKPILYENETQIYKEGYITDLLTSYAIQYIKEKHSALFFLSLQFNAPHWPWQGPGDKAYPDTTRFIAGGSPEIYAAMMKSLDDAIGKLMQVLDETGLAKNTVVIFTSDNGGEKFSDMGIFNGSKGELWEGGIRVPAFVRWPGIIPENVSTGQAAITMDWTATILAIAGANADPDFPLDGENLLTVMTGNKKEYKRTFFWRLYQEVQQKALRFGKWKYLQNEKGEFLFDLSSDPGEKNNMKEKNTDIFENLKSKYAEWEKTVLKPVPL